MIKKENKIKYYKDKINKSRTLSKQEQEDDYINLWEIYGNDENSTDLLIAHCKYRMEKKYSELFYSLSFDYDLEDLLELCINRELNYFQLSEIEDLVVRFEDIMTDIKMIIEDSETEIRSYNIRNMYDKLLEKYENEDGYDDNEDCYDEDDDYKDMELLALTRQEESVNIIK